MPQRQNPSVEAVNSASSHVAGLHNATILNKGPEPAPMRGGLKLRDACQYLGGVSIPTMHRLIGRGLIRPNRSLRHLLFPISELDRFLREGMS